MCQVDRKNRLITQNFQLLQKYVRSATKNIQINKIPNNKGHFYSKTVKQNQDEKAKSYPILMVVPGCMTEIHVHEW